MNFEGNDATQSPFVPGEQVIDNDSYTPGY